MPAPLVTTPTVAHMTLESPSDKAITSLYRAALGPVNTERYMPVFARLDAVGRTLTSWHWSACFFTLGWMVFRRLWGAALVYVAAAEGVALLVFGVGRPLLQWPQGVEWGVVGAFAVVGSVIPGLYAHAILHADIRKRVTSALAASANIPQACDLLAAQAVSRKRLHGVIGGHALIVAAALLAYVLFPQGLFDTPAAQPAAAAPQPASRAASWNQPEPTLATASRTAVTASVAALPASPQAPLPEPDAGIAALAASAPLPAAESSSSASAPAAAPAPTEPASQAIATSAQSPDNPRSAKSAAANTEKRTAPPPASKASAPTKASAPAPAASKTASATKSAEPARPKPTAAAKAPAEDLATVGSAPGFYINVGLFADESNARKAQSRLLNEGLPAFRQTLDGAKGTRVRVRVGPYASRSQAEAAAATVKALGLEAVVFRK
ncbi:SPOR domain-containing protein [Acidovorax sp. IB03]|uniref:SPOR domain-containing protein n=1 Tax=Acidovorax sp. IB03 TaxID=2779366 RepID=UPI001E3619E1|nr:SPOR domain-containing protein [Acidovorax sp. IB03]